MSTRVRAVAAGVLVIAFGVLFSVCGGSNSGSPTSPSAPPPPVSTDNASAHYVSAAQGGQPSIDMVLFFNVSASTSSVAALGASRIRPQTITIQSATAFNVTGSYSTGTGGFSGSVTGTLSGTPSNGTFQGVLTANLANGCVASKNYSGTLTTSTLNWMPGSDITDCNGTNPLTFSVSTQAVPPSPVTPTSGTYSGSFSVPVVLGPGADIANPCRRIDTNSGTLTLTLTIATDGTVTGTGHAIGTEMVGATIGPSSCGSQPGATTSYETVPGDQVAGTTSNFGFIDSQTVPNSGGTAVFGARFFGSLSGNTITGVFTNSEDIHDSSAVGCNGAGGDCVGTGENTVTLTRQ